MMMTKKDRQLLSDNIDIAYLIKNRLQKTYYWIDEDDLFEYALFGFATCVLLYNEKKTSNFAKFANTKGFFLAVDEARKDGVIQRKQKQNTINCVLFSQLFNKECNIDEQFKDQYTQQQLSQIENEEMSMFLLNKLTKEEKDLITELFLKEKKDVEVARERKLSKSCIHAKKIKALKHLKEIHLN